jgi:hypothetical protein
MIPKIRAAVSKKGKTGMGIAPKNLAKVIAWFDFDLSGFNGACDRCALM